MRPWHRGSTGPGGATKMFVQSSKPLDGDGGARAGKELTHHVYEI
jgi:hypothetical protein